MNFLRKIDQWRWMVDWTRGSQSLTIRMISIAGMREQRLRNWKRVKLLSLQGTAPMFNQSKTSLWTHTWQSTPWRRMIGTLRIKSQTKVMVWRVLDDQNPRQFKQLIHTNKNMSKLFVLMKWSLCAWYEQNLHSNKSVCKFSISALHIIFSFVLNFSSFISCQ